MGRSNRRRPTGARRATFAAVALMLGGGGLVAVNVYASATESGTPQQTSWGAVTIDCPDVGDTLTDVPDGSRADVDKELALLDQQIAEAYQQLQDPSVQDRESAQSRIVDPLQQNRAATIERITAALERTGGKPDGLGDMAGCTLRETENQNGDGQDQQQGDQQGDGQNQDGQNQDQQQGDGQQGGGQDQGGQQQGNGGQAGNGPVAADYADINSAPPAAQAPPAQGDASRGTFVTSCGVNANGLFNSDNVIVAPGVSNGAHHFHDYVGNQSNTAFASDQDLANAETSCADQGDKSTYYWPVIRLQNGTQEQDANKPGGGVEGNAGKIVTPKEVTLTFVGNPRSKVTAMPRLLRIITGDAKAFVNGTANANASWSCTGFEDRQLKDKYPLCPQGSDVVRTFKFQSCWDGRNIDSANHRTHVAFAQNDGTCPNGFKAIPQLVQRIVYDVDAPSLNDGGRTTPLFAVDSFPEQLHKPVTDHGDFINVFDENLMNEMVGCINDGRECGAGTGQDDPGNGNGGGDNGNGGGGNGNGGGGNGDNGGGSAPDPGASQDPGNGDGNGNGSQDNPGNSDEPQQPTQTAEAPAGGQTTAPADNEPKTYSSPTAHSTTAPSPKSETGTGNNGSGNGNGNDQATQPTPQDDTTTEAPGAVAQPPLAAQPAPQGNQGSLAETGTQLWPAALGAILLISGFVLLRRTSRRSM
ncbi:putative membrane protein YgcG [Streptomyces sp. SLBN-8D4]